MKDKHPIDDLFREGLASRKITPSPQAWDSIQGNLNQGKAGGKRIYFLTAVAASVCLLCAATWTYVKTDSSDSQDTITNQVASIDKKTSIGIELEQTPEFKLDLPSNSNSSQPVYIAQTSQTEVQSLELSETNIPERNEVILQSLDKNISLASIDPIIAKKPYFNLPNYISSPEIVEKPRGMRFNIIKSVVSMAKGVNDGKKAISEMRKSKIEFINEDLKYGSEKESESEATIDQDSPSNEK